MYDFHMHSTFSADCEVPMEEMVQAGIKQQLKKSVSLNISIMNILIHRLRLMSTWINMKMKSKK